MATPLPPSTPAAAPSSHPQYAPTSPSPSPPPLVPTALAPGARATALTRIFSTALAHTLAPCTRANFAACFPTPARAVPEALDALHADFVARLDDVCKVRLHSFLCWRGLRDAPAPAPL